MGIALAALVIALAVRGRDTAPSATPLPVGELVQAKTNPATQVSLLSPASSFVLTRPKFVPVNDVRQKGTTSGPTAITDPQPTSPIDAAAFALVRPLAEKLNVTWLTDWLWSHREALYHSLWDGVSLRDLVEGKPINPKNPLLAVLPEELLARLRADGRLA